MSSWRIALIGVIGAVPLATASIAGAETEQGIEMHSEARPEESVVSTSQRPEKKAAFTSWRFSITTGRNFMSLARK